MDFQQSQTFKNLQTAFDWEVNVSTTYSIYGDTARQEGYIQIGNIFDIISRNEKEHARIWMRKMNNGTLPDTQESLRHCAELELYSGNQLYREFARVAREEGFDDLASLFNGVANIVCNAEIFSAAIVRRISAPYADIPRVITGCITVSVTSGRRLTAFCASYPPARAAFTCMASGFIPETMRLGEKFHYAALCINIKRAFARKGRKLRGTTQIQAFHKGSSKAVTELIRLFFYP